MWFKKNKFDAVFHGGGFSTTYHTRTLKGACVLAQKQYLFAGYKTMQHPHKICIYEDDVLVASTNCWLDTNKSIPSITWNFYE